MPRVFDMLQRNNFYNRNRCVKKDTFKNARLDWRKANEYVCVTFNFDMSTIIYQVYK